MSYSVREMYYTLQGEGAHAGTPAVFCRFSGCNLWSGREEDRAKASCWFCDTDFVGTDGPGGGKFASAEELSSALAALWPNDARGHFVVFTGGEPLLQLDEALLDTVRRLGFKTAVETNGTIEAPRGLDWITVSPKPKAELVQRSGNELKLVYPHEVQPEEVASLDFEHFFLSPLTAESSEESERNRKSALEYCLAHPKWKLTMQYHKIWGIP